MAFAAMWLQEEPLASIATSNHLIMIFIGILACSMAFVAIMSAVVAAKALAALKEAKATLDTVKGKALPLMESGQKIVHTAQTLVEELTPKIKTITDNLVSTTTVVRGTTQELQKTVADANLRTQRQVARVDTMVTAALATTAEIVQTVNHGIRVPAQKIAALANQAKFVVEGVVETLKGYAGSLPFAGRPARKGPSTLL